MVSLFIVVTSCTKKELVVQTVEVEKKYSWNELKNPNLAFYNKQMLGVRVLNDSLIQLYNHYGFVNFNSRTLTHVNNQLIGFGNFALPGTKPLVDNKYYVYSDANAVNIRSAANPGVSQYNTGFSAQNLDSHFVRFVSPDKPYNIAQAIAGDYLLMPYLDKRSMYEKQFAYLAKLKTTDIAGLKGVDALQVKKLTFTSPGNLTLNNVPNVVISKFNKFFISYADDTYRVDTLGNIKAFGAPMYSISGMFTIRDYLFAVNHNGRLYVSTDQGENFDLFINFQNLEWSLPNYVQVGKETFAIFRDHMIHMTLEGNDFTRREIVNDGLEGNTITDMAESGDYVFVTTLSGTFYRKKADFIQYIKP